MSDHINKLIGRLRVYVRSSKYIITEDIFAAVDTIEALRVERDRLTREVDALQQWKDAAKAAEASWDLKEVGKLISAPLGAPIRPAIQPAIERLAAEIKQLRAENERLLAALTPTTDPRIAPSFYKNAAEYWGQYWGHDNIDSEFRTQIQEGTIKIKAAREDKE